MNGERAQTLASHVYHKDSDFQEYCFQLNEKENK